MLYPENGLKSFISLIKLSLEDELSNVNSRSLFNFGFTYLL